MGIIRMRRRRRRGRSAMRENCPRSKVCERRHKVKEEKAQGQEKESDNQDERKK